MGIELAPTDNDFGCVFTHAAQGHVGETGAIGHKEFDMIPVVGITVLFQFIAHHEVGQDILADGLDAVFAHTVAIGNAGHDKDGDIIEIIAIGASVKVIEPDVVVFHKEIVEVEVAVAQTEMLGITLESKYTLLDLVDTGLQLRGQGSIDRLLKAGEVFRLHRTTVLLAKFVLLFGSAVDFAQQVAGTDGL